jgi:hypothetical protein
MNLGLHLPRWGSKKDSSGTQTVAGAGKMCYSEAVRALARPHRIGFVMLSNVELDQRRMRENHGAIANKQEFLAALQSKDLIFKEVSTEAGLFFYDRNANAKHRLVAEREMGRLDYLIFFAVTYEPMPGNSNIWQDTLRPRMYNKKLERLKTMDECFWSDQTIPVELEIFIGALAESMRMQVRIIIRKVEGIYA